MKFKDYDYKERKKKVEEILDNTDKVNEVDKFPRDEDFTYTNGYKAWASAIFVDLRDSTTLFSGENDVDIAKVIRGFTSEIIEILRTATDNDLKEIGIRGDCVFAIYSTQFKKDIFDVADRAFHINTYMKMLNKLLEERNLPTIKAGIGLATNKTLAVKAGRKSSGINNLVWIGESVAKAAKLSDLGNKNGIEPIVMSSLFYSNYIDVQKGLQPDDDVEKWWTKKYDTSYGTYYHGTVVQSNFDKWITDGMQD
ncbi:MULTISPECIES: adenylate/guanylate cyclase domain-containing protein [Bacillus cereus group]|uniref:adenylate/guanylate cyclase domain-containing protein n=1 Tax=Bacillus cereus group TaxID=86661 RepID=UPI000772D220|nr:MULTISPECIES: adenylate/guanylate cyclase domain-containing protein [Bacillus cereus group]KXI54414.1 adenylate cyclase [Bacillus cereus]MDA2766879.1 adenylate/guanylate cyclase domain-containing protein [Bacillus cereus group sp. Bc010]MED1448870.1 adenylate/guanylate cyclase domain-containing protein [Bacillus pacificus]